MGEAGLEPARGVIPQGILSPLRLPIPSLPREVLWRPTATVYQYNRNVLRCLTEGPIEFRSSSAGLLEILRQCKPLDNLSNLPLK